jgi:hypothetical protein
MMAAAAAAASADLVLQSQLQILQNPAKPAQAPAKVSPRKKLRLPWISLSEMSLFNRLR